MWSSQFHNAIDFCYKSRLDLSSASESSDGNVTVSLSSDSLDVATSGTQSGPSTVVGSETD